MRKGALAAALLLAAGAAGAWWFVASSGAPADAARSRTPDAVPRAELLPAESAPALDAVRTENRAVAAPPSGKELSAEAYASGATNWDQTAKTSGIELDVIDAQTGERLRGVTVEQGGENYESATSREPPGGGPHAIEIAADAERVAVAQGDAPLRIQLPPKMRRGRIRYLIGAPGHATVARWFDVSISGWRRHVVALWPGWPLEVVVRGGGAPQRGKVELFEDMRAAARLSIDHPPTVVGLYDDAEDVARKVRAVGADVSFAFETTSPDARFERRIEGLSYGQWLGLATFGDGPAMRRHAFAVAFVDDDAESGRAERLEIDLSKSPSPRVARFAGTVRFAPGWTAAEVAAVHQLVFTALDVEWVDSFFDRFDVPAVATEDDHRLAFDAQQHDAGRHVVTFDGIAAALAVDVEGERPLELFVDEPATVELSARDRSGAPRNLVLLRYLALSEVRFSDRAFGRVATRADGTAPPVRVQRGPFHVETEPHASVSFVARTVDLVAGENAIDLVVGDYSGVRLELRDGAVPVPWTFGTEVVVARADAPNRPLDVRRRTMLLASGCQIDLEAPCRYVVAVRGVPGFEDPAPVEIDVASGEIASIEVALTTVR